MHYLIGSPKRTAILLFAVGFVVCALFKGYLPAVPSRTPTQTPDTPAPAFDGYWHGGVVKDGRLVVSLVVWAKDSHIVQMKVVCAGGGESVSIILTAPGDYGTVGSNGAFTAIQNSPDPIVVTGTFRPDNSASGSLQINRPPCAYLSATWQAYRDSESDGTPSGQ